MNLNEARELRQELEAIEATMERIKDLWMSNDFPSADNFEDLARAVGGIRSEMDSIEDKAGNMPTADEFDDLGRAVGGIEWSMDAIIAKAGEMPTATELVS